MKLTRTQRSRGFSPLQPGKSSAATGAPVSGPACAHVGTGSRRIGDQRSITAFTLVEIAISVAIIGFALVAIIGVLPTGLNVQKENREDTIINNEANFFMDAIRNGARGLDDLTNHVYAITIDWRRYDTTVTPWAPLTGAGSSGKDEYYFTNSVVTSVTPTPYWPITNGATIVGLLGMPKYTVGSREFTGREATVQSNYVMAYVRSMTGAATEQFPQTNSSVQSLAFAYRMIIEVTPVPSAAQMDTNSIYAQRLRDNLHEVRLRFRWPLFANGRTGDSGYTYRSLAGGNLNFQPPLFWYFQPQIYSQAQ